MKKQSSHLTYKRFFRVPRCFGMVLFLVASASAIAHEITVFNLSGSNLVAGALVFPVGKTEFIWPYDETNLVFDHAGYSYSFPVAGDFHLTIDSVSVYAAEVMSTPNGFLPASRLR